MRLYVGHWYPILPSGIRRIGNDKISALGFGAMPDEERFKVKRATFPGSPPRMLKLGCAHCDTANAYELLGNGNTISTYGRKQIFLATKASFVRSQEASTGFLEKLEIDTIDLYYVHRIDTAAPIETTMGSLVELVKVRKTRYIGLSESSPAIPRRAHKAHPVATTEAEVTSLKLFVNWALQSYSPLGSGLLTGQVSNFEINDIPKHSEANLPKILSLGSKTNEIRARHDATPGQVTLAFILAQGDVIITIPKTSNVKYVEETLGA
ncbi:Aldo/keto reductase [Ceratobasidium sp. AG-I]|nr:Aldo/keto reductase [Ceratobasidium sp. AG-I]